MNNMNVIKFYYQYCKGGFLKERGGVCVQETVCVGEHTQFHGVVSPNSEGGGEC